MADEPVPIDEQIAAVKNQKDYWLEKSVYPGDRKHAERQHDIWFAVLATLEAQPAQNPCAKIFDHKWLDPVCVENGCQSLFLPALLAVAEAARDYTQSRNSLGLWDRAKLHRLEDTLAALPPAPDKE
jgi:hypothetical protein